MKHSYAPQPIMQAAEREEDFMRGDQPLSHSEHEAQSVIRRVDPITGHHIANLTGKPSLVEGDLTMYFESEQTRQVYLDRQR